MSTINWTNLTNAGVTGTTLSKTSGTNATPNAGATSTEFMSGDGTVTITVPSTVEAFFGVQNSSAFTTTFTSIPFAIHIYSNGGWDIREANIYKTDATYVAGDTFSIVRSGTTITYKKNGATIYTSTGSSTGDLYVNVVLWNTGTGVSNGDIVGGTGGVGGGGGPTLGVTTPTTQLSAPTTYTGAITDRISRTIPPLPTLPTAINGTYTDPSFLRTIRRMSNASTGVSANVSHRLPSSEQVAAWGRDSDRFFLVNTFGASEYHTFNQTNGTCAYVRTTTFGQEPTFSRVAGRGHIMYGTSGFQVKSHDTNANTYTTLIDLTTVDPTYAVAGKSMGGSVQSSASNPERMVFFYGGGSQDHHFRVCVFDVANPTNRLILDTQAKTVNGTPIALDHAFLIHAIGMDQSGQYVIVYPTGTDQQAGAAQMYAWDVLNGTITGNYTLPYGHDSAGYGTWFNNAGDIGSPYDAFEFGIRFLNDMTHYTKVISPQLTPQLVNMDTHPNWANARSDANTPPVIGTYRFYENVPSNLYTIKTNTVAWRACDNEIVSVAPVAGGTIYRWCHHQSNIYSDDGTGAGIGFWYEPIPQISPNGRWILFASNMQKTLGTDSDGNSQTVYRTDTWLIDTQEGVQAVVGPHMGSHMALGVGK